MLPFKLLLQALSALQLRGNSAQLPLIYRLAAMRSSSAFPRQRRLIVDAIRRAERPVGISEVVDDLLRVGGHGEEARRMLTLRVRSNLAYQVRQGKVRKEGEQRWAKWRVHE